MRNTSETDYVIKCNHVSADGHFDSLKVLFLELGSLAIFSVFNSTFAHLEI